MYTMLTFVETNSLTSGPMLCTVYATQPIKGRSQIRNPLNLICKTGNIITFETLASGPLLI